MTITPLNITDSFTELVSKFNQLLTSVDSDSDFRSKISVIDAGGDGSLTYSTATGIITYTGPSAAEARSHFSASGDLTYDSSTGVFSFTAAAQRSDSDIRGLFSVTDVGGDGSLSYNANTGTITYTGPSASEVRSHFSAGNGITITSGSVAIKSPTRFRLFDSNGSTILDLYGAGSL